MSRTSFIGRDEDLAALLRAFEEGDALVTITGPAGIGKTRLARELASKLAGELRVLFVDLTEANTPDDLVIGVGEVLGTTLEADSNLQASIGRVGEALRTGDRSLLVLDNFEQLVGVADHVVVKWLDVASSTKVLLTSRELLRIGGERVHDLAPLAVPAKGDARPDAVANAAAVRLLVDRVRHLRRDVDLSTPELALFADIVRELDGIPLAIELAAVRVGMLGAANVRERLLHQRFDMTNLGMRDASARQRTLRTAIAWSWNLLNGEEQSVLAQCSVFRGPFTLEAIEAVVSLPAGSPDLLTVFQALREKSLVADADAAPRTTRFRMYLSIRDFAEEQLRASGDAATATERHARFFLRERHDEIPGAVLARLAVDRENLLAIFDRALDARPSTSAQSSDALRVVVTLAPFVVANGGIDRHLVLVDRALDSTSSVRVDPSVLVPALAMRARLRRRRGRAAEAEGDQRRALDIARAAGLAALEARTMNELAMTVFRRHRVEEAAELWEAARLLHRELGERQSEGVVLTQLAVLARESGDHEIALSRDEEALAIHSDVANQSYEVISLANRALTELELDDLAAARVSVDLALSRAEAAGSPYAHGLAVGTEALLHLVSGKLDAAADTLERLTSVYHELNRWHGGALGYLGLVRFEQGRYDDARSAFERCAALLPDARYRIFFLAYLGAAERMRGNEAKAQELDALIETLADADPLRIAAELAHVHADLAAGETERALDRLHLATTVLQSSGVPAERRSYDVRIAARIARRALEAAGVATGTPLSPAPVDEFEADPDGEWFSTRPGRRVSLRSRKPQRLLFAALLRARQGSPNVAIAPGELVRSSWPDQRLLPNAAKNRLQVAIAALRKAGLREVLLSRSDGYLLDPAIPLRIGEAHFPAR